MTQAETAPPTFVIFCNRSDFVTRAYENFLKNRVREDLGLEGVPVRLVWRERGKIERKDSTPSDEPKKPSRNARSGTHRQRR